MAAADRFSPRFSSLSMDPVTRKALAYSAKETLSPIGRPSRNKTLVFDRERGVSRRPKHVRFAHRLNP